MKIFVDYVNMAIDILLKDYAKIQIYIFLMRKKCLDDAKNDLLSPVYFKGLKCKLKKIPIASLVRRFQISDSRTFFFYF